MAGLRPEEVLEMATKASHKRKRGMQDSTLINVAASKKRHTAVLARLRGLEQRISTLEQRLRLRPSDVVRAFKVPMKHLKGLKPRVS